MAMCFILQRYILVSFGSQVLKADKNEKISEMAELRTTSVKAIGSLHMLQFLKISDPPSGQDLRVAVPTHLEEAMWRKPRLSIQRLILLFSAFLT